MTEKEFIKKFELLADTPNAVEKMRKLVFGLAVQGKLGTSRTADESAVFLVRKAKAERERLEKNGKIKRQKVINLGGEFEQVGAIPLNWTWTTLAGLGLINPRNNDPDDKLATFVPMTGVPMRYGSIINGKKRLWGEIRKQFTHFADGDVALAKITPCFQNGKSVVMRNLTNSVGAGTTELHVVRPIGKFVDPYYIWIYLKSPSFLREGESKMTGSAGQKRVPTWYFAFRPFPLPPLAEQKRIVAKVDALMALCDRLEAQQQERDSRHVALSRAALARFNDEPTPANLNLLFHKSYPIAPADLRKTILSLAVRGKLVHQDPRDEPVSKLLSKVRNDRVELKKNGERRIPKNFKPIKPSEFPWAIPSTWAWQRLAEQFLFIDYRGKTPQKQKNGVRLITAKNIRTGYISLLPEEFVSDTTYKEFMTRGIPRIGDVLFTTEAPLGNAAVVNIEERFALAQRTICFRVLGTTNPKYAMILLLSPQFQKILIKNATGITASGIKSARLKLFPFATPPRAEQRRIVAKVDALMALVDRLEAQLAEVHTCGTDLMDAVVAELTDRN